MLLVSKKSIAIIPARGGSKRIPKKNIISFKGKPMIAWTIEAAIESDCFDRILVSTDDFEISEIAKFYGAECPFMRFEKIDDFSPVSKATISALNQASYYWNEQYYTVTQLMANCPLRNAKDIRKAHSTFFLKKREFQISCFKYGWTNPWWANTLDNNGVPKNLFPQKQNMRSQDLPDLYCPTGAIWIAIANLLKNEGSFYGCGYRFEPIEFKRAVDIDDYEDLKFAESITP